MPPVNSQEFDTRVASPSGSVASRHMPPRKAIAAAFIVFTTALAGGTTASAVPLGAGNHAESFPTAEGVDAFRESAQLATDKVAGPKTASASTKAAGTKASKATKKATAKKTAVKKTADATAPVGQAAAKVPIKGCTAAQTKNLRSYISKYAKRSNISSITCQAKTEHAGLATVGFSSGTTKILLRKSLSGDLFKQVAVHELMHAVQAWVYHPKIAKNWKQLSPALGSTFGNTTSAFGPLEYAADCMTQKHREATNGRRQDHQRHPHLTGTIDGT